MYFNPCPSVEKFRLLALRPVRELAGFQLTGARSLRYRLALQRKFPCFDSPFGYKKYYLQGSQALCGKLPRYSSHLSLKMDSKLALFEYKGHSLRGNSGVYLCQKTLLALSHALTLHTGSTHAASLRAATSLHFDHHTPTPVWTEPTLWVRNLIVTSLEYNKRLVGGCGFPHPPLALGACPAPGRRTPRGDPLVAK